MIMQPATSEWPRFLAASDARLVVEDGFLVDPTGPFGRTVNPDVIPATELLAFPAVAVLGEPGIGKTTLQKTLVRMSAGGRILSHNLALYASDSYLVQDVFQSKEFRDWLQSDDVLHLFLDSLDECLQNVKTVAGLLAEQLRRVPISRLQLRIFSRSADWPKLLQDSLQELWGAGRFRVFELAPLRRVDVEHAATSAGLDAKTFLERVSLRNAESFAARPLTLDFLLSSFAREGNLPESSAELYEAGCLRLAAESSDSRQASGVLGQLTAAERLEIAELLAAVSLFSKSTRFAVSADLVGSDVFNIGALVASVAKVEQFKTLSLKTIRETLSTALFSARGLGAVGWAHWTYGEFLAGRFLAKHFPPEQLLNLLLRTDADGHLRAIPQLEEVVGWVSAFNPDLRDIVVQEDPLALARSRVAGLDDESRAAVVSSLLNRLTSRQAFDGGDVPIRYELLCHPRVGQQIAPLIADKKSDIEARRAAIRISEACAVTELTDLLADRATDTDEPLAVREAAAGVVVAVGTNAARERLRVLLESPAETDSRDQLRGQALRALWRANLLGDEIWKYIVEPQRQNYFGTYQFFLSDELQRDLAKLSIVAALEWTVGHRITQDSSHVMQGLVDEILRTAWRLIDQPGVVGKLAEAVIPRLKQYASVFNDLHGQLNPLAEDDGRRRRLLVAIVDRAKDNQIGAAHLAFSGGGLLAENDFAWLLERSVEAQGSAAGVWAELVRYSFRWNSLTHTELTLEALPKSADLRREMGPFFEPVRLDSPEARRARAEHSRAEEFGLGRERGPKSEPIAPVVDEHLAKIEQEDPNFFWRLVHAMETWRGLDGRHYLSELEPDITSLPAWSSLHADVQRRVIDAAYRYVISGDPSDDQWVGTSVLFRPATAGCKALLLMIQSGDTRLEILPTAIWEKWAASIVSFPLNERGEGWQRILRLAYERAPDAVIFAAVRQTEFENTQHRAVFVLRRVCCIRDTRIASAVFGWLSAGSELGAEAADAILEFLLPVLPLVYDWAIKAVGDTSRSVEVRAAIAAVTLRFVERRAQLWQSVWDQVSTDDALAIKTMSRLADRLGFPDAGDVTAQLSEEQMESLYLWLRMRFPPETDPDHDRVHTVGDRERLSRLRDVVVSKLKDRANEKAVETLRRLAMTAPVSSRDYLAYLANEADRGRIREGWVGLNSERFVALLQDASRRVVESDDQLLTVLDESLRRLQDKFSGETSAAEDVWDEDRPKDELSLSDYIARHVRMDLAERGVVVNREVEVRRGSKTDVRVEAISKDHQRSFSVTIEVKGCWHRELETAMETQLAKRYLAETNRRCGVYAVCWFSGERWTNLDSRKKKCSRHSLEGVRLLLAEPATLLRSSGFNISVVVLDCTAAPRQKPRR
jgi:hypothetical protein